VKTIELEAIIIHALNNNLNRIPLVVWRKHPPSGHKVRVKGLGLGEIANAQPDGDQWRVVAWFYVVNAQNYLSRVDRMTASRMMNVPRSVNLP